MAEKLRGILTTDAPLKKLNTWRVGGHAKQLYKPADIADLSQFLKSLSSDEFIFWLGLGSNLLVADQGIDGTVILTQGGIDTLQLLDDDIMRLEAGVTCAKAAKFCVANNFLDGEFFAGIPGTIGGALAMNAGAFGGETWPHVVAVETINRQGTIKTRTADEYQIAYRSVQGPGINDAEQEWFVAGHFKLPKGDGVITKANIKALLKQRGETQPIGLPSCGSTFINPAHGHAGQLIEASGLKGFKIGGAEVSPKHANFIINTGTASAADIAALIKHVQATVAAEQQINLRTEVRYVGFEE